MSYIFIIIEIYIFEIIIFKKNIKYIHIMFIYNYYIKYILKNY